MRGSKIISIVAGVILIFIGGIIAHQLSQGGAPSIVKGDTETDAAHIAFVGDIMLDRYIRERALSAGYDAIFDDMRPFLSQFDSVVGNLEGPVAATSSVSMGSAIGSKNNMRFVFSPQSAAALERSNIRMVTLANNHVWDQDRWGIKETHAHLSRANVDHFGSPLDERPYRIKTISGIDLAIFGISQFGGESISEVSRMIRSVENRVDATVVYAHWGKEYEPRPSLLQRSWANQLIQSGADLVVGSHPHVVQSKGTIEGKPVYYSLGNFVFDQYHREETQRGIILCSTVAADGEIDTTTVPMRMHTDGTSALATTTRAAERLCGF